MYKYVLIIFTPLPSAVPLHSYKPLLLSRPYVWHMSFVRLAYRRMGKSLSISSFLWSSLFLLILMYLVRAIQIVNIQLKENFFLTFFFLVSRLAKICWLHKRKMSFSSTIACGCNIFIFGGRSCFVRALQLVGGPCNLYSSAGLDLCIPIAAPRGSSYILDCLLLKQYTVPLVQKV